MKLVLIFITLVGYSTSIVLEAPADTAMAVDEFPGASPEERAQFKKHPECVPSPPLVWWIVSPFGCDCYNRNTVKPFCKYPGIWLGKPKCKCWCPDWAHLLCAPNQYLDKNTCQCKCKSHCDCTPAFDIPGTNEIAQVWSKSQCKCVCPQIKACGSLRYFDYWTCDCQCRQKPRACCPNHPRPFKVWSPEKCDCACEFPVSCNPWMGLYWDESVCRCLHKFFSWGIDYAAEAKKIEEGIVDNEGVLLETTAAPVS